MTTSLELQQAEAIKKLTAALLGGERVEIGYTLKESAKANLLIQREDERIQERINAMVELVYNKNFTMRF